MKKQPCLSCGSSQINHKFAWFDGFVEVMNYKFNRAISNTRIMKMSMSFLTIATPFIVKCFSAVGIISFYDDVEKVKSGRGKVLWEEALTRGISMRGFVFLGKQIDSYEAARNKKKLYYSSVPTGKKQNVDAIWWMDDKALLKNKLLGAGLPVARGGSFFSLKKALKEFEKLDKPVIVKPRLGSRGRHTTTAIFTKEELKDAFRIAKQVCPFVVMEEHLQGSVYRGTVIDGILVAVLRGDPPRITGDGVHTIIQLVEKKNSVRNEKVKEIVLDSEHDDFLRRYGYDRSTVLPVGVTTDLTSKVGISYGGMSAEITPEAHPAIKDILVQAANLIDYPIIGFDFIIEDATADPSGARWGIIEANSAPYINLHHHPLEGAPVNVAAHVWDMVEKEGVI